MPRGEDLQRTAGQAAQKKIGVNIAVSFLQGSVMTLYNQGGIFYYESFPFSCLACETTHNFE